MNRKVINEVQIILEFILLILLFVPKMYLWKAEGANYSTESALSFIAVMKNLKSIWMIIFLILEVVSFGYYMVNALFDIPAHKTVFLVIFPVVRLAIFGVGSAWLGVGMVRSYLYQGMERLNTCTLLPLFFVILLLLILIVVGEILKVFSREEAA